ncbi:MAG: hypothetical protein EOP49_08390, partial [Sphingobacteriales bacterium]
MIYIIKLLSVFLTLCCSLSLSAADGPSGSTHAARQFVENKGQVIDQNGRLNPSVRYSWHGKGLSVHLKINSFSYEVRRYSKPQPLIQEGRNSKGYELSDSASVQMHRVDVELIGANPHPKIIAAGKSEDYLNFYTTGTPEEGVVDVHQYSSVTYKDIYSHIDLQFVAGDNAVASGFKYNFIIHPGARIEDIRLAYHGADKTMLKGGNIFMSTSLGELQEEIPHSFEQENMKAVNVRYVRLDDNLYGFKASGYNKQHSLLVDPWCTYYGGEETESGNSIAVDQEDNLVVAGSTQSTLNIASSGVYQINFGGGLDAFVVKMTSEGSRVWATYYGGSGSDQGYGISTDNEDNIILVGSTLSSSSISTAGSFQPVSGGNGDCYLVRFTPSGIRLWATYFGGPLPDQAFSIATDSNNSIIIGGETTSNVNIATPGAHQTIFGGDEDGLLVKFDSSGNRLWATYYGGGNVGSLAQMERFTSLCTDAEGNIIGAGTTSSKENIASPGAHLDTLWGGVDAFVAKFDPSGTRLWGTYYGGEGNEDVGYCVTTDATGNILLTGNTNSIQNIATPGSHQTNLTINTAFLAKLSPSGTRLWGTYYGNGIGNVTGSCVATGDSNSIFLAGRTFADPGVTTPGSHQPNFNGTTFAKDAFLVRFDSNGFRQWGTYFGGPDWNDEINAVATDHQGNVVVTGYTQSDTNIATPGAYQDVGSFDAFIASFSGGGKLTTTSIAEAVLHSDASMLL